GGLVVSGCTSCISASSATVAQLCAGLCWTAQLLPSGSLKKMKEFQSPPGPSFWTPSSKCWIVLTSTPRDTNSARAASMSATTNCRPFTDPGGISERPLPIVTEHAEPGGVNCTTRNCSPARWSTSTLKPTCSL